MVSAKLQEVYIIKKIRGVVSHFIYDTNTCKMSTLLTIPQRVDPKLGITDRGLRYGN